MKRYVFENGKLHLENLQLPELKKGYVLIQNTAFGVNFLDRESLKNEDFTSGKRHLGFEAVGVIKESNELCERKWVEGQGFVMQHAMVLVHLPTKFRFTKTFSFPSRMIFQTNKPQRFLRGSPPTCYFSEVICCEKTIPLD